MDRPPPRAPAVLGSVLAVVLGTGAAFASTSLAARVMDECEIGVNAAANSYGLMFALPFLALIDVVAFATAFRLAFRAAARAVPSGLACGLAFLAGLVPLTLVSWGLVSWSVPPDYPVPAACPGDLSWWPSWIPL